MYVTHRTKREQRYGRERHKGMNTNKKTNIKIFSMIIMQNTAVDKE